MGASRRRIDRRLSGSAAPLGPVPSSDRLVLIPAVSIAYAATIAAGVLALDQLAEYMPGAWVDVLGAALLVLSVMTIAVWLRAAWRRRRGGPQRRAPLW